jgi:hypothetical protein
MKKEVLVAIMMICTLQVWGQDFENFNFGDSREAIENFYSNNELKAVKTPDPYVETLQVKGRMESYPAKIEFILIHDELASGSYYVSTKENLADFNSIYPIYRKKYGDPDNLLEKKNYQTAHWYIGGDKPYSIEIYSDSDKTEVRFAWEDRIEDYRKALQKESKKKSRK